MFAVGIYHPNARAYVDFPSLLIGVSYTFLAVSLYKAAFRIDLN